MENITNEVIETGAEQAVEQAGETVAKSGGKGKWIIGGALLVGGIALAVKGVKKLKAKFSKKKACDCPEGECDCEKEDK